MKWAVADFKYPWLGIRRLILVKKKKKQKTTKQNNNNKTLCLDFAEQHLAAKKFSFRKLANSPMVDDILKMPLLCSFPLPRIPVT